VNPIEHLLIGWAAAQVVPLDRRDRAMVTIASVVPDIDGFGILPELITRGTSHEIFCWTEYHHTLCHNLLSAVVLTDSVLLDSARSVVFLAETDK
jgi:hypothetical protein